MESYLNSLNQILTVRRHRNRKGFQSQVPTYMCTAADQRVQPRPPRFEHADIPHNQYIPSYNSCLSIYTYVLRYTKLCITGWSVFLVKRDVFSYFVVLGHQNVLKISQVIYRFNFVNPSRILQHIVLFILESRE